MPFTDYPAKYFAYELTKRCASDSVEKLAGAVAGAQVDLNPHQVDAALNEVFLKCLPEQGEEFALSVDLISRATIGSAEILFAVCQATGFVGRRTDVAGGTDPYEALRCFRSIF